MTAAIGLGRLPHAAVALLGEAAANLVGIANDLDALIAHGPEAALATIGDREAEGDRITHDLIEVTSGSLRAGPDRLAMIELAQAIDDIVDLVDGLAWSWSRSPATRLGDLLLCVRDIARAAAAVARSLDAHVDLTDLRDAARTARAEIRSARAWLLVEQDDAGLAVAAHDVVTNAEQCVRACLRLGERIDRRAAARP